MSRRRLVPPGWERADPGVPRFWESTEGKAGTCKYEVEVKCPPTHTPPLGQHFRHCSSNPQSPQHRGSVTTSLRRCRKAGAQVGQVGGWFLNAVSAHTGLPSEGVAAEPRACAWAVRTIHNCTLLVQTHSSPLCNRN